MKKDIIKLALIGLGLFLSGFLLKSIGLAETSAQGTVAPTGEHLTVVCRDGLTLHAWKIDPMVDSTKPNKKPGLALLLPMMSKTHTSYDPFAAKLREAGFTTIAFDMRGHGQSVAVGDSMVSYSSMGEGHFKKMPDDIETFFFDFQINHPDQFDYDNVLIIGASIGANSAGMLLGKKWVARSVLLSPGDDYRGLRPGRILGSEKLKLNKPIYIAAAVDDTYSAQSSQRLFDGYTGPKVFKKYPGKDHGTNILHNITDADMELLSWLAESNK